jgi:hypothetical protein
VQLEALTSLCRNAKEPVELVPARESDREDFPVALEPSAVGPALTGHVSANASHGRKPDGISVADVAVATTVDVSAEVDR